MARRTAKLFDLMIKNTLKEASSVAVTHLINGLIVRTLIHLIKGVS